jgi:hypothetical protein
LIPGANLKIPPLKLPSIIQPIYAPDQRTGGFGGVSHMTKPPKEPKSSVSIRAHRGHEVTILLDPPKPIEHVDGNKVGKRTVAEASIILTNELNGLSGGAPGELARAKTAVAHTIYNGLISKKPPQVAAYTLSREAASSIGRKDDQHIMRQVHVLRATGITDPVNGAVYYGTSKEVLNSRPIGKGRQRVLHRFGPFDHGKGEKQYVYIYGNISGTSRK